MNPVGLPQGAATSPIFANIGLKKGLYDKHQLIVGYADDGIKLTNGIDLLTSKPLSSPEHGIFEKEGSGYVKKDGIWLKPLKFLGMVYNPFTNTLSAETKKGSRLELKLEGQDVNIETIIREYDLRHGIYHQPKAEAWEMMIKSRLAGWIQARLYGGT